MTDERYSDFIPIANLVSIKCRFLANKNMSMEDIQQEAWVGILNAWNKIKDDVEPDSDVKGYLFISGLNHVRGVIAKNESVMSTLSKHIYNTNLPNTISTSNTLFDDSRTKTIDDILESDSCSEYNVIDIVETAKKVAKDPRQYDIWRRHVVLEQSMPDIAKCYNITKQRVGQIVSDINSKLRPILLN